MGKTEDLASVWNKANGNKEAVQALSKVVVFDDLQM